MKVIHISAECYPIAKVGGLADVVGALPKYQNKSGISSAVVMPFYNNLFTKSHKFKSIFSSELQLGYQKTPFRVLKIEKDILDFDVYFVDINNLLFKDYVYSNNDTDRFLAFQIATLDWLLTLDEKPDYIHCHDHHTGLIPFFTQECYKYKILNEIPTITTIHNAQYQGWMSYDNLGKIPEFDLKNSGLLDWNGVINPLAGAIKCAWRVTTVSPTYMEELKQDANGLEDLLAQESNKCVGILNGIDTEVWNPETDDFIIDNYSISAFQNGKKTNKKWLCSEYNLDPKRPLFAFIGRLVGEKGTDVLPKALKIALRDNTISVLVLGSGSKETETALLELKRKNKDSYNAYIGYDEKLSHIIYAGADFLLMPSRVEPCGLNQMYALRYGTVPIVRRIGGLKDTIVDIENNGFGICHDDVTTEAIVLAIKRAVGFYKEKLKFKNNRKRIMQIDHSWDVSAKAYIDLYHSIK